MYNTEAYKEMKLEFESAIACVEAEKGLVNVDKFKEKEIEAFNNIAPVPHIAFGNKKVPETTAICNTTSWFCCPGRLQGFCDIHEHCYDKCREIMGNAIQSRHNHDLWWRMNPASTIAMFYIYSIKAESCKHPDNPIDLVRFQEVGDFRNQEDLEKMVEVSNLIFKECGINSYTYTHNKSLDFDIDRPHLCICGSGFMIDNNFNVIDKSEYDEYISKNEVVECPQDCGACGSICSRKLGIEIVEVLR